MSVPVHEFRSGTQFFANEGSHHQRLSRSLPMHLDVSIYHCLVHVFALRHTFPRLHDPYEAGVSHRLIYSRPCHHLACPSLDSHEGVTADFSDGIIDTVPLHSDVSDIHRHDECNEAARVSSHDVDGIAIQRHSGLFLKFVFLIGVEITARAQGCDCECEARRTDCHAE